MRFFGRSREQLEGVPSQRRPFVQRETASSVALPEAPGSLVITGVFTPTQPKTGSRQITGRQAELQQIIQALLEDRAHVVLYSDRGRGKTSLSNVVVETLRRHGVIVARHTCDARSDFDSIVEGLMRDLPSSLLANPLGQSGEGCQAALPPHNLRPGDVVAIPSRLTCKSLVWLVDEFDRVRNPAIRTQLADTIKQLSDRDVRLQFLVVGVSANLDEILGQHPSIQRSVTGIHLPLFSDRDMAQLISKASRDGGFNFPPEIVARITVLARGTPYMAQLLGLRLTQAAAQRSSSEISEADLETATARLLADANPRTVALYNSLTDDGRDEEMVRSLRCIASASQDRWGQMDFVSLADGRVAVGGRRIQTDYWNKLCNSHVLVASSNGTGVTFASPALMHHALLLATANMTEDDSDRSPVILRPFKLKA